MTVAHDSRVVVVGQGYVGLPLAVRAVEVGHTVVGFDLDKDRVDRLRRADSFIDDITDDDLRAALDTGRYLPTDDATDLAGFTTAVVCVPTPLRDGAPNLSFIEDAARLLAPHLRRGACVVLESTTYPGTTEEVFGPILDAGSGLRAGVDYQLGYSPERIDPGNPTWGLQNTPKIVSGVDDESGKAVTEVGAEGELVATGTIVAQGYWGDRKKTAERFQEINSFRTGDIVQILESSPVPQYRFVGRRDHLVKSRGYRIELGEIEAALYSHPAVEECVAVAVPDEMVGNRIAAFCAVQQGADSEDLARACRVRVRGYMVPEPIVVVDSLPRTPNDKYDRPRLTEQAARMIERAGN